MINPYPLLTSTPQQKNTHWKNPKKQKMPENKSQSFKSASKKEEINNNNLKSKCKKYKVGLLCIRKSVINIFKIIFMLIDELLLNVNLIIGHLLLAL